jgi:hypothetical protein
LKEFVEEHYELRPGLKKENAGKKVLVEFGLTTLVLKIEEALYYLA